MEAKAGETETSTDLAENPLGYEEGKQASSNQEEVEESKHLFTDAFKDGLEEELKLKQDTDQEESVLQNGDLMSVTVDQTDQMPIGPEPMETESSYDEENIDKNTDKTVTAKEDQVHATENVNIIGTFHTDDLQRSLSGETDDLDQSTQTKRFQSEESQAFADDMDGDPGIIQNESDGHNTSCIESKDLAAQNEGSLDLNQEDEEKSEPEMNIELEETSHTQTCVELKEDQNEAQINEGEKTSADNEINHLSERETPNKTSEELDENGIRAVLSSNEDTATNEEVKDGIESVEQDLDCVADTNSRTPDKSDGDSYDAQTNLVSEIGEVPKIVVSGNSECANVAGNEMDGLQDTEELELQDGDSCLNTELLKSEDIADEGFKGSELLDESNDDDNTGNEIHSAVEQTPNISSETEGISAIHDSTDKLENKLEANDLQKSADSDEVEHLTNDLQQGDSCYSTDSHNAEDTVDQGQKEHESLDEVKDNEAKGKDIEMPGAFEPKDSEPKDKGGFVNAIEEPAINEPGVDDSVDDSEHQIEKRSFVDEVTDTVSYESNVNHDYLLNLGKSLEKLRIEDQLCDITINVKDTKFRAHKVILCAASPVLQNQLNGKEELSQEIDIPSYISSMAVETFIHYLYTGELHWKVAEISDIEKLSHEYGVENLTNDLEKGIEFKSAKLRAKSVNTQTDITGLQTEKFDLVNKPKGAQISVDKSSIEEPETDDQTSFGVQNESALLESDEDNDADMDYDDNLDSECDLLADSDSVAKQSRSKLGESVETSNSDKARTGKINIRTKSLTVDSQSEADVLRSAVNIKKEMSCEPPGLNDGSGKRQSVQTESPVHQNKSFNAKVTVEKLPSTINPSVTVVVGDDEDLTDCQIEFVAGKMSESENSRSELTQKKYTLEEKEQIALEAKRHGTTQTSKARNIPLPDILSWMTFFGLRKPSDNIKQKLGKQVNHEAELSIVRWIVQQQEIHGKVNLDAMRNYALAVYRQSQPSFVASKTWLANFFKRNISLLQGTNFIHGEEEADSVPIPVKLTQIPVLVDPVIASIESQINEHESALSSNPQDIEDMDTSSTNYTDEVVGESEFSKQEQQSSNIGIGEKVPGNILEDLSSISNSVTPSPQINLGGISTELLAKIRSKPVVIGTAVMFDAKTERKLAEWLVQKQQKDGYVYRDDFVDYAKSVHKGNKRFQASKGWIQLFMRRNSVRMPLLKQVVFKSKFKTYYSDEEKVAIVQQARKLGVPHVAKMLGINSGVIHSWKMGMDAEDRRKGGPKNFEKVTRSVTRAFPSISKEVDAMIDLQLKEKIKASIDVQAKRKAPVNPNRGPDPELEKKAIEAIKQAEIVRYQDVKKICYEVYTKKRPDFQASRSWVLKFVNTHLDGLEGVEVLKSWFDYPEKNQLRLKYADKMTILEEEKIHGVEKVASMKNISCGTIRFWKKYPPNPEDDENDAENEHAPEGLKSRKYQTDEYEYIPSKFQPGKKVRRRVVIGEAVIFTAEVEVKLVQWIHDHLMADNSIYTDDFRDYAKSLYTGSRPFSASSTWLAKFVRRNPVLRGVNFISKYKRFFTEEEKYAAVMEARRFGTSYVAKKLNADSGLINSWKIKFARYSAKKMARLKQSVQLERSSIQNLVSQKESLAAVKPPELSNPDMSLEEIEKEVGSGLHSYKGEIPVFEREIVKLILDENKEKGGVTYEDISRLCRSVYERTRPHFKASQNWTRDFIKRHEEALKDVNIENRKKMFIDDDEPLNHSTSRLHRRHENDPVEVSPLLQKIMVKKPILIGQSRTLEPKMERKLVQWMIQKQAEDGYVFMDEFNEYAKSLYRGSKKFAATQAWRIKFFRRNKAALKHVKLESKYRKQFTREEKMAIVSEARRLGIGHVARKLDINSSLIYSWGFGKSPQLTQDEIANEKIEQDVGKGLYCQRGNVPTIEKEIVRLIQEKQNEEGSVSYDDISNICRDVYKDTRPSFKASYRWTMEFIKRHKEELKGVDIENMKKVYYEDDDEQPGLQSFISTLNQNMDTTVSDSLVQIENLEKEPDIDFHAHSFEESDLNLNDLLQSNAENDIQIKQESLEDSDHDQGKDSTLSSSILERIRASKPDIVAQPKTFDLEVEKKMVKWLLERQARDAYVFTDDFIEFAKSIYTGSEPFTGSQTWRKNFLRRHRNEVKDIIFRSKHVNTYTEKEKQMVVEEARKLGIAHVAKMCGLDHRLVWSWKVKADQENKTKQNAFWKGPKKTTSVISKPSNVKHAVASPILQDEEPLGDAFRGVVPEFENRIIKMITEHQNREGSISYEEISEISRNIYQETRPNFKAGYGWIKNFLQRHKGKLKNIDIENMKKLYLPDDDAFVPASGKNIRDLSDLGNISQADTGTSEFVGTTPTQIAGNREIGNTLESLQKIIAKKPIVLGVPKSFNIKTEKKLVQWLLEQQAEQGYAFLDEFKDFASSLYTGDKKFAATNAWRTQFLRRNHAALKHVKLVSKFRKTFTEEEKLAIVKEAKRLGVGHVSRQLDIGHGNINVWMRELEAKGVCSSGLEESPVVSESSNSSFTSVKGKRKESTDRQSSNESRHASRERSNTTEKNQEDGETGSGLFSARGIVPVFEKKIVEEVLDYYKTNESIKYDDISRISQNIYKETRPSFKASHNWIKDFMSRHADKLSHLVIQNAREFLTQREKREVLAEVEKHGLSYVSKVTNISSAQLLAWKEQLENSAPVIPSTQAAPVQTATELEDMICSQSSYSPSDRIPGVRSRKYTIEEKKRYVAECEKHGLAYVSSTFNVPKTNLGRWMKEFKTQHEDSLMQEEQNTVVPVSDKFKTDFDPKIVEWVLNRDEEIGVVLVTHLLDFAQATISKTNPSFMASEEWLSNFIAHNSSGFKDIKFRYPEEVTKNKLNFTQHQKDKLCLISNTRPVVEVATLAGIYPYTLYDWRKHYKRKQAQASSASPEQLKSPPELLKPKEEPQEVDGRSRMQEKLARIEGKYNDTQKQDIANEAREDGTTSTAKKRGIPLPLVLKWMKIFPETIGSSAETTSKSVSDRTPKSGSRGASVPKSNIRDKSVERKSDTQLKVKLPVVTPKQAYSSKSVTPDERRKLVMEFWKEGAAAVSARSGVPKSTLYHWSKTYSSFEEDDDTAYETSKQSQKNSRSSKSSTPDINVKKEAVDSESFTDEQKKEIALETKSLGYEQTAKKRGLPTAVVIEWMGIFLGQSPVVQDKSTPSAASSSLKTPPPRREYTEEEKIKVAEQALEMGAKEAANLTGIHLSNVRRWADMYKKKLKGRQHKTDKKEKDSQSIQDKNKKRHKLIQNIMKENVENEESIQENFSTSNLNAKADMSGTKTKPEEAFTFEYKLRVLQAADEMGIRNASQKFKVDPALIFQWRKIYDYAEIPNPAIAARTATVTSSKSDQNATSTATSAATSSSTSSPFPSNTANLGRTGVTGEDEIEAILISDDEGSCSPCSNHSWQSDDLTPDVSRKRKSDFGEANGSSSAKRGRVELNESFGVEDSVRSDVIDFAYTIEQKQSIVRESNTFGPEKVSKMTNIPVSLIMAWKSQFANLPRVKTEKE